MKPLYIAMFAMIVASLLGAIAQILLKKANPQFDISIVTNWLLIVAVCLYGCGFVINIVAYRYGTPSVLYPMIACSYLWVVLLSSMVFGEVLTWNKVVGCIVIVGGIALLFL